MLYRDIFMYHTVIAPSSWIYMIVVSIVVMMIGFAVFNRLQKGFAEEI